MRRSPERGTCVRAGLWVAVVAAGLGLSAGLGNATESNANVAASNPSKSKSVSSKPAKKLPASTFAKVMAGSNSTARILSPQSNASANVAGNTAPNASNSANTNTNASVASTPASAVERQPIAPGNGSNDVHTASSEATVLKVSPPASMSTSEPKATLEEQVNYQYNTLGRRDPFQSMIDGEFVGNDVGGSAPPDVGGLQVVGIVWGDGDKFALVEDGRGNSHVLRPGDKVMNGVVTELRRDAVVVSLTTDEQTQQVTIPLIRKGDKNDAR
ncbi:MAG: hypothetical protein HOP12_00140 [Candidatus Eisenbacteria bacterium]|uniref:Type IV pilus biogenesis protein PilP n=1 Tax=Eiseniibacteriota bacterium TaxID=2212470 RepID=A0A849SB21_UNCEI|nr:hypothetical protein [Candidatus Eisenbacteria bacterium]